jgi:hypothetical protein
LGLQVYRHPIFIKLIIILTIYKYFSVKIPMLTQTYNLTTHWILKFWGIGKDHSSDSLIMMVMAARFRSDDQV